MGKAPIQHLLERKGLRLSVSTVGRILSRATATGSTATRPGVPASSSNVPPAARIDVRADQEPTYVDDKRAGIRIATGSFNVPNVPVEIKKSDSRGLWNAIHSQLLKHTRSARRTAAAAHGLRQAAAARQSTDTNTD